MIGKDAFPDEVLAELRGIEKDRHFFVNCGHAVMSEGLAVWRQTGEIGWHLTDKGRDILAAAKSASSLDPVDTKTALENGDSR